MGRKEDDLNVNMGLSRGSTEADRQRYRDYVRADEPARESSSPPGGLAILIGLFRRFSSRPRRGPTDLRAVRVKGAVLGAMAGTAYCHLAQKPLAPGAMLGAAVGAAFRELAILAIIALIALWIRDARSPGPPQAPEAGVQETTGDANPGSNAD